MLDTPTRDEQIEFVRKIAREVKSAATSLRDCFSLIDERIAWPIFEDYEEEELEMLSDAISSLGIELEDLIENLPDDEEDEAIED